MHQAKAVKAKKHLGQHFLTDEGIAKNIAAAAMAFIQDGILIEVGPGMGMLSKYLINKPFPFVAFDVDEESITYLKTHYPDNTNSFILGDFLHLNIPQYFNGEVSVIGNFPYNISSQILFKILDNKEYVPLMVGMFQKEVAERICSQPGNKNYGILSVLAQAYYDTTYLFTVSEEVFIPPPKVKSGVMRMVRKSTPPNINEPMFKKVVKMAFNQRRKKLRNALAQFNVSDELLQQVGFADKRAEELSTLQFMELTELVIAYGNK